jgi:hypothetical protein
MALTFFVALGCLAAIVAALLPVAVRRWRTRWTVAIAVLAAALVAVVTASTLAPRQVDYGSGLATCIEEPLFGISSASSDSTPECIDANRNYLLGAAAVCALVLVLEAATCRVVLRRTDPSPLTR